MTPVRWAPDLVRHVAFGEMSVREYFLAGYSCAPVLTPPPAPPPAGASGDSALVGQSAGLLPQSAPSGSRAAAAIGAQAPGAGAAGDTTAADLRLVSVVVSEAREVALESVDPQKTFAQLGVDDVTMVEIIIDIEKRLAITIPETAMAAALKQANVNDETKLTVAQFGTLVTSVRKR